MEFDVLSVKAMTLNHPVGFDALTVEWQLSVHERERELYKENTR
jgi:hypothetical protein